MDYSRGLPIPLPPPLSLFLCLSLSLFIPPPGSVQAGVQQDHHLDTSLDIWAATRELTGDSADERVEEKQKETNRNIGASNPTVNFLIV